MMGRPLPSRRTSKRREELAEILGEIMSQGFISAKQVESIRDTLHWFEFFAFGRVANGAVRTLSCLALKGEKPIRLADRSTRFTDSVCEDSKHDKSGGVGPSWKDL